MIATQTLVWRIMSLKSMYSALLDIILQFTKIDVNYLSTIAGVMETKGACK